MIDRRQFMGAVAGATAVSLATRPGLAQERNAQEAEGRDPISDLTRRLNPQIQASRDVALGILKPSTAELDRGLKLHAESLPMPPLAKEVRRMRNCKTSTKKCR